MIKVKICGVNSVEALAAATEAGADWVGFVFFPPSPRALTPDRAAALSSSVRGGPGRVGLFVQPSDRDIAAVLEALNLDALQVHAPAERAQAIRERFGLPLWRTIGVSQREDLPASAAGADRLLLDAKPPDNAELPGGNARPFDWSVLQGWTAPVPWLLAGGLTSANVGQAIAASGAAAVDVSSGVERSRGIKDAALIRAFVAAARAA